MIKFNFIKENKVGTAWRLCTGEPGAHLNVLNNTYRWLLFFLSFYPLPYHIVRGTNLRQSSALGNEYLFSHRSTRILRKPLASTPHPANKVVPIPGNSIPTPSMFYVAFALFRSRFVPLLGKTEPSTSLTRNSDPVRSRSKVVSELSLRCFKRAWQYLTGLPAYSH